MNKKLAYGGIGTALSVVFLALCAYLPTGRAASLFLSSLVSYIIACMTDKKTALMMFVASAVLSVVISPAGMLSVAAVYIICFGNYPILKNYIDLKPAVVNIFLKFVCYTIYALVTYTVFLKVLNIKITYNAAILYILGALLFAFYDFLIAYTGKYALGILYKRF